MSVAFLKSPVSRCSRRSIRKALWSYGVANWRSRVDHLVRPVRTSRAKGGRRRISSRLTRPTATHSSIVRTGTHRGRVTWLWSDVFGTVDAEVTVRGQVGHRNEGDGANWRSGSREALVLRKPEKQSTSRRPDSRQGQSRRDDRFCRQPRSHRPLGLILSKNDCSISRCGRISGLKPARLAILAVREHRNTAEPLGRPAQLTQVLMMSNEFAFVD